jgi:hypothetical protein
MSDGGGGEMPGEAERISRLCSSCLRVEENGVSALRSTSFLGGFDKRERLSWMRESRRKRPSALSSEERGDNRAEFDGLRSSEVLRPKFGAIDAVL